MGLAMNVVMAPFGNNFAGLTALPFISHQGDGHHLNVHRVLGGIGGAARLQAQVVDGAVISTLRAARTKASITITRV